MENESSTQTSHEESFKNLDRLTPEDKTSIEIGCREIADRFRGNFQDFVRERTTYILPFAAILGEHEGQASIMVIPFLSQVPIDALAATIRGAVKGKQGVAFITAYDGFTSYIDDQSNLENKRDRKDAIITVWRTAWGTGEHVAVRYAVLPEFGAQFEPPTVMDAKKMSQTGYTVFENVFTATKLPS